jgi:lambda family phage portal protein
MAEPLYDRLLARYMPERALARSVARMKLDLASDVRATVAGHGGGISASSGGGYATTNGTDPWYRRWTARPRSANADTLRQLPDQRGQSRDLVRNNAIAASAVNTTVARSIGTGLALSPQPHLLTLGWTPEQGAAWAAEVAAEFSLWGDSTACDWYGEQNFYDLQDLVTRGRLESGDCWSVLPDAERTAAMPYALRVQVLEADRVGNPNGAADTAEVSGGVRRAAGGGVVTGYHVYRAHPGSGVPGAKVWEGDWIEPVGRSGRRRMLHHFKRIRPEQARGIPYLAPVISLFKLATDYTDAELKAAVVSAFLTLVVTTPGGTGPAPVFQGNPAEATSPAGELALGPAAVIGLAKGESAEVVNPGRPNPQFGAFLQAVVDQIGAGTFLGPELLIKKFNTSYTAARAAFLDAWKHLLDVRTRTARDFCQPVFETWLAEAVLLGRISAPGFFSDARLRWAYTRALWRGDSQGSLNPKDEVAAFREAIEARLTTHEHAEWEMYGTDFNATYGTKLAELQRLRTDGIEPRPRAGAAGAPPPQPTPAPAPQGAA